MYNDKNNNIMKFRNVMSAVLLVGSLIMVSCSQDEELIGQSKNNDKNQLQITVTDAGVRSDSQTRAVEDGYTTTFEKGDAIGVYAVNMNTKELKVENRKFVLGDDGWELALGTPIEYVESEMGNIKFYAYYPYQSNGIEFSVPKELNEDPFVKAVTSWSINYNDLAENYTKYDLMTSVATDIIPNGALGNVEFQLNHRMSMALIALPAKTYTFTNEDTEIAPYSLPAIPGEFKFEQGNDVSVIVKPYYDKANDQYRILAKPNEEYTVSGTYTLGQRMTYTQTLPAARSKAGTAVKFKLKGSSINEHNLQAGDYYCADGSIVGKDAKEVPTNAIGVVFFVGNPQVSALYNYTEYQDALKTDFPNCKHGLVVALKDANNGNTSRFSESGKNVWIDNWKKETEDLDRYLNLSHNNSAGKDKLELLLEIKGYNHTKIFLASQNDDAVKTRSNLMCNILNKYKETVPTPSLSTGWFCPSFGEFNQIIKNYNMVKASIESAKGSLEQYPITGNMNTENNTYWASNFRSDAAQWISGLNAEEEDGKKLGFATNNKTSQHFRFCLAF